jgi:hypothetical protein
MFRKQSSKENRKGEAEMTMRVANLAERAGPVPLFTVFGPCVPHRENTSKTLARGISLPFGNRAPLLTAAALVEFQAPPRLRSPTRRYGFSNLDASHPRVI